MKRSILTAALAAPFLLFAQQGIKGLEYSKAEKSELVHNKLEEFRTTQTHTPGTQQDLKGKAKGHQYIVIGKTYYDLQTNGSMGNRVLLHSDGTVSAVWTTSPNDDSGWPERGSAYNHYDGNGWSPAVTSRIEPERVGFPNIYKLMDGSESIIAHQASSNNVGGFYISNNGAKGSTNWTTGSRILDDETQPGDNLVPIWNRTAAGNGYVHMVSTYWSSTAANVPFPTRNGVDRPMTYSRSSDDGATWDKQHTILPGYDSTFTTFGGVGEYAIDVKDSIVAIVAGRYYGKLAMWKSMDNGESFTMYPVDNYPYGGHNQPVLPNDTVTCNDGSMEVIIDADNKVHVFYGTFTFVDTDTSDQSILVFTSTSSIAHWSEGMASPQFCAGLIDMDEDPNTFTIARETWNSLDENDVPYNNLSAAARYGSRFLATMPTASVDANGNIYLVYCAPVELVTHFTGPNFRDIHVVYSTDGGQTWSAEQNLTQDRTTENAFPFVAKDANDFLHLVFMQDLWPGTHLINNSIDGTHPNDENDIVYTAIPVSTILNDEIGPNTLYTPSPQNDAEVFVVHQNQPNPFNGTTEVLIYLQAGSDVDLTVRDLSGKLVSQRNLGVLSSGNHVVNIDASELSSGMYFYTISSEDHSITRKMQVD